MTDSNSPTSASTPSLPETISIDLRDPWLAAFLAWLVPGLGHMYQRRWGKGGLFMTCILATFFYGLWLGGGRVVYASFRDADTHYAYLCQVGVGLPALPAVVQAMRVGGPTPKAPLFDGVMAPPMVYGQIVPRAWVDKQQIEEQKEQPEVLQYDSSYFQAYDPDGVYYRYIKGRPGTNDPDQLSQWHNKYGSYFDLGGVFTWIAGLLNILVIWDAWGGPAMPAAKSTDERKKSTEEPKEEVAAS